MTRPDRVFHVSENERSREGSIQGLYSEIRQLMAREQDGTRLDEQLEQKRRELRELQRAEAEEMYRRAEARLHLKKGTGREHLERAEELLEE